MKTGEEKFDDEIRQKLRYSEASPPEGFFDHIVPPSDNKRGFFWMWLAGIIMLGITAWLIKFMPSENKDSSSAFDSRKGQRESSTVSNVTSMHSDNRKQTGSETLANNSGQGTITEGSALSDEIKNGLTALTQNNTLTNHNSNPNEKFNSVLPSSLNKKPSTTPDYNSELRKKSSSERLFIYDILYTPVPALPYSERTELRQQIKAIKHEEKEFDDHTPSRFSLELGYSQLFFTSKKTLSHDDSLSERLLKSYESVPEKNSGFDACIKVLFALNKKFTLKGGLSYVNHQQEAEFRFDEFYRQLNVDTNNYYILFPFSPPQLVTEYDSTIETLSREHRIHHNLTSHTIAFSAGLSYNIPIGRFIIEPGVSANTEVFSFFSGTSNLTTDFSDQPADDYYKGGASLHLTAQLQAGYAVNERINILLQSGYLYPLTSGKTNRPFYKEKKYAVSAGISLRYNFFKAQAAKAQPQGSDIVTN